MQDICAQAIDCAPRISQALSYRFIAALLCAAAVCPAQLRVVDALIGVFAFRLPVPASATAHCDRVPGSGGLLL